MEELLRQIVSLWEAQIEAAMKAKWQFFGQRADQAWQFYLGDDAYLLFPEDDDDSIAGGASIFNTIRVNKAREFVALLLPHIHYKVPERKVQPRNSGATNQLLDLIPGARAVHTQHILQKTIRASLVETVLNYLPSETGAYREQRMALPEALIKGRGVLWSEITEGPNGDVPGSFYDSVDNLYCDPDAKTWRTCGYIIRRREMLISDIEDRYGLPQGYLQGSASSHWMTAIKEKLGDAAQFMEHTNDIGEFYEIYSRVGIGVRLSSELRQNNQELLPLENLGPYVYLAVMPGVSHPLNLTPAMLESADAAQYVATRLQWPIQVQYNYDDPWPCTILDFYPHSSDPWAMGCLDSVMPYMAFMHSVYSNLMRTVPLAASRLVVVSKSLESQVNKAILSARDLQVVYADERSVSELNKLISTFAIADTSGDQWRLLNEVERQIERGAGLDPLLYGATGHTASRSAADVRTRATFLSARVNDYADAVADWNSRIARKEGQLCRLHLAPQTIAGIMAEPFRPIEGQEDAPNGPPANPQECPLTMAWMQLVMTDSPQLAAAELDYTVEASTGLRKDREKVQSDIQQIAQTFLPLAIEAAKGGVPGPYNAITEALGDAYDWPESIMQEMRWPIPSQMPQQQPPSNQRNVEQQTQPSGEAQAASQPIQQQADMAIDPVLLQALQATATGPQQLG